MNLVEKLLKIDKGEITKELTKEVPSKMLAQILGEEKVKVKIKSLDGSTFTNLSLTGTDDEGNTIMEKAYDTNALIASAGIVEPDLKSEELLRHVGAATPAEAAKILFKGEVNRIAVEVSKLSGFGEVDEEEVKKVKN